MFQSIVHGATSRVLRLWLATSSNSWRRLPRPADEPHVHASGVTPDRVLVVGSGAVVGYGVLSWELSLSGQLAKRVAGLTGRGLDIDISADPELDIGAAVTVLSSVNLARYDGIMFMLGALESLEGYPLKKWEGQLLGLVEDVRTRAPASVRVWFIGVPPLPDLVRLPRSVRARVSRHVVAMNQIVADAVRDRPGMHFVPLNPRSQTLVDNASREVHVEWASLIAPAVAAALDVDAPRPFEVVDEAARLRALNELRVLDGPPDEQLQNLVDSAREVFDVAGASFNLIDATLHRVGVASGLATEPAEMPRSESFCSITIAQSRLFVIHDMTKEPAYREKPFVTGPPALRFYAGYPVEAPDGQRIGSLCIIDTKPRAFGKAEQTLLRDLALRVQARVWERSLASQP